MQGVKIEELEKIGENDSGKTLRLDLREIPQGLLAYRKAGSVSGNHYHKGISPGKNPEKLTLVSGIIQLHCKNLETSESAMFHLRAPVKIEIHAMVWHEVHALTDIVFIELNSLEEHTADTFRI